MSYRTELDVPCHCGNLRLTFKTNLPPSELPLRRCLCSYCTAHGNVYTSDSAGELLVRIADESQVSRYRNPRSISDKTMYFLVCRTCGVVPAAISEIDGRDYAVVSITGGSTPDISANELVDKDFDAEDLEGRLERRKATWIADVRFE